MQLQGEEFHVFIGHACPVVVYGALSMPCVFLGHALVLYMEHTRCLKYTLFRVA